MSLAENEFKIITYGDSTTATRLPDVQKVYSDILRENLPAKGVGGEVINKGVGGANTDDAVSNFDTEILQAAPDLVVIQFGINDALGPDYVSLEQYTQNITGMVDDLNLVGAKVVLMTPNRLTSQDALLVPYVESVRTIADAQEVSLVDVYQMFTDYAVDPSHSVDDLLLDGQHPNQAGHDMIATALEDVIVQQLIHTPEPGSAAMLLTGSGLLIRRRGSSRRH